METKFKVGDKVRILNVYAIRCGENYWKNGDVAEVATVAPSGDIEVVATLPKTGGRRYDEFPIFRSEFHAIELVEETPKMTKSKRIYALEKITSRQETEIEELTKRIEALEKERATQTAADLYDHLRGNVAKGAAQAAREMERRILNPLTPNQRRAQIIAEAKQFVEEMLEKNKKPYGGSFYIRVPNPSIEIAWACSRVDFVVNAEKRTVVALAIGYTNGAVVKRAIAKCAPDDVFNADIGKAIAVGRLFGLDVERFINAPKPDEVVVGHVVEDKERDTYGIGVVDAVKPKGFVDWERGYTVRNGSWNYLHLAKITDDTEAQYE